MKIKDNEIEMSNYAMFKGAAKTYGFSLNNFYDVIFEISAAVPLYNQLRANKEIDISVNSDLMRLYTDEASLPGIQMSTSEYRINNTPTLKYVYGSVFSEAQFSFIMDADSTIKSIFDVWTNWMYGYTIDKNSLVDITDLLFARQSVTENKFRTKYRDEYAVDITIIKYERAQSSKKNSNTLNLPAFTKKEIIPDLNNDGSGFFKAIPVYAVKLFKAFPSNISSVSLNSGTSELAKLSVTFEYETISTTSLNAGSLGNMVDTVNGGNGDRLSFEELLQASFSNANSLLV